ncbi:MAG: DUF4372 domain-containing protein [Polaromonas sp.]|nr:DUF4372 domain-containing protein [Polaromonas sp.]
MSMFRRGLADRRGQPKVKDFSCLDQIFAMAFARRTYRERSRDIEVNLRAQSRRVYRLGFLGQPIARDTPVDTNVTRLWQICADFTRHWIRMSLPLYANKALVVEFDAAVCAVDVSIIDTCPSLFAWAPVRSTKAAIKVHVQLDLRGSIPGLFHFTDGKIRPIETVI